MEDDETLEITTCTFCQKTFKGASRKDNAATHLWIHEESITLTCSICSKKFAQQDALEDHLMRHFGQKPYYCSYCKESFTTESEVIKHEKIHNRTETCEVCGKIFSSKYLFGKHIRTHIGESHLYSCITCGEGFSQKSALNRHRKIHSDQSGCLGDENETFYK